MLKKTEAIEPMAKEVKKLRLLKRKVKYLQSSLESLVDEHDFYSFDSDGEASEWFHSLPVESLQESLALDHERPREKFSLQDMGAKSILRKKYYKEAERLEKTVSDLNIANIDILLLKINNLLNK